MWWFLLLLSSMSLFLLSKWAFWMFCPTSSAAWRCDFLGDVFYYIGLTIKTLKTCLVWAPFGGVKSLGPKGMRCLWTGLFGRPSQTAAIFRQVAL